mmetsp:Transcript_17534/g.29575  ORF Transcript_17534/g.29575 Transcript_17534/m.29575 type:complete len:91 (-) Transcript_17534:35-307(-)
MLTQFQNDTVVHPRGSEYFEEISPEGKLVSWNETELYTQDWIGFRNLTEAGKTYMHLVENADHLQYPQSDIGEFFIPFLYGDLLAQRDSS